MFDCLYYWLIAPLRSQLRDSPSRVPAFTLTMQTPEKEEHELCLFSDDNNEPEFGRLRLNRLASEVIPESALPLLQAVKEHLLTSLRLTYKQDIVLAEPSTVWSFVTSGEDHNVQLNFHEFGHRVFDPQKARDIFAHTYNIREVARLYADGVDTRLPLQYRFLSLYKMLENRYRTRGRWDHAGLAALLDPYAGSLTELGFQIKPAALLHEMRDRCAHITTGNSGRKEVLGVTHLNLKEAARVENVLPVLRAVCAAVINERSDGKFYIDPGVKKY